MHVPHLVLLQGCQQSMVLAAFAQSPDPHKAGVIPADDCAAIWQHCQCPHSGLMRVMYGMH